MHPFRATEWRRGRAAPALPLLLAAMLLAPALQGCDRGADSGATPLGVAPGRPGTGNGVEHIAPKPESITESPQVGGARGRVPEGVTGDSSVHTGPGVGLDGGLGAPGHPSAAASQGG